MKINNLWTNQKGSATIYLVITFAVLVVTIGVLIDLTRIRVAQHQLRTASNSAIRSVLANYNSQLRNTYGLFACNSGDYQKEYTKYLRSNLPSFQKEYMFRLNYENSNAFFSKPLSDPDILKRQILEDMKYKAPVDFFRELADKFGKVNKLSAFFQKNNTIRKSFVTINNFFKNIHESNQNIKNKRETLIQTKKEISNLEQQLSKTTDAKKRKNINDEITQLKKFSNKAKKEIDNELKRSERVATELEIELGKLDKLMGENSTEQDDVNQDINVEDEKVNKNINEQFEEYRRSLLTIKQQIEKSRELLNSKKNNGVENLSDVGVEEASNLYKKIIKSLENPDIGNNYDTDLKNEVNALSATYKEINKYFEPYKMGNNPVSEQADKKAEEVVDFFRKTSELISLNNSIYTMRDELYIDQYILKYFSNLTTEPKGEPSYPYKSLEAEYICFGNSPAAKSVTQLYFSRFALDSAAYFAFSKVPVELIQRMFYSLTMGAVQAAADTYKLIAKKAVVPVANMSPQNPLRDVTINYTDHLRLFLLLNSDEKGKLSRIAQLVQKRSNFEISQLYTDAKGESTVSIKLWFLPSIGFSNMKYGPFGTKVVNGQCYITKQAEYEY